MNELVTGTDRAQLLQALAQHLEPSLPAIRSQLRTQDELEFVVAGLLGQCVSQVEQMLEDDGRADQVRSEGLWYAWDSFMASRGRVAGDGEHMMPELRLYRSESVPGGPTESPLGQLIRVAVEAGVRAATPQITESVIEVTGTDGETKTTRLTTARRVLDVTL
jgi:hypothetical protein